MSCPSARRAGGAEKGRGETGSLFLAGGESVGRGRVRTGISVVGGAVRSHAVGVVVCAAVRADDRGSDQVVGVLLGAWTALDLVVVAVGGGIVLAAGLTGLEHAYVRWI